MKLFLLYAKNNNSTDPDKQCGTQAEIRRLTARIPLYICLTKIHCPHKRNTYVYSILPDIKHLQYRKDNGEYGNGIFNGDVGYITDIDIRGGILKVRYDDRVATYFSEDLSQLELAYAVTVHKSQGSEYDYVIIPLCEVPSKLRYRNLLYTGVTRAKKMLILVGSESVWEEMAANDRKTLRYTMLKTYLLEAANEND